MKRRNRTQTALMVLALCWCFAAGQAQQQQQEQPADPKLAAAYQRLRFDRMYPVEAAAYIRQRLQHAPRALDVLGELAKDERPDVRAMVALLLGELGEPDGARLLWSLVQDRSEFVRVTAAGAIKRLSLLTPVAAAWSGLDDERPEVRRLTAAVLKHLEDKSAEHALLDTLRDPDEMVRMEAASALATCGTVASVPSLVEALHDDSVLVRTQAASSLGHFDDPAVIPALIDALNDPDWHVRAASIISLAMVAGNDPARLAQIIDPIAARLKEDEFALVRDRAADALAAPGDQKAIAALVGAIVSDNRDARFHAHEAIIRARAVSALPQLLEHVKHPNPDARQKIIRIFGEIGGADQTQAVLEALGDPDPAVRWTAVVALNKLRERGALQALLEKTADPDAHVRAAAARTLGELGDRSAVPKLIALLRDPHGFVRGAAAEALGKLGDRSATRALVEVLVGEKPPRPEPGAEELVIGTQPGLLPEIAKMKVVEEKIKAVRALGEIRDPEAVDPIIEHGLKAEDAALRAESAVTLGKIGEPKAAKPLQEVVRPYYEAVPEDVEGVIAVGPVDENVRLMKEREARVRASVAWALGQLRDPSAREILMRAANDENSLVRDAALEALARIAEREEQLAERAARR